MTYDDFAEKLRLIRYEFSKAYGKELETVDQLEEFLVRRKASTAKPRRALRSLKGLSV